MSVKNWMNPWVGGRRSHATSQTMPAYPSRHWAPISLSAFPARAPSGAPASRNNRMSGCSPCAAGCARAGPAAARVSHPPAASARANATFAMRAVYTQFHPHADTMAQLRMACRAASTSSTRLWTCRCSMNGDSMKLFRPTIGSP